ncbi:GNAT family N-acetyltransferase [Endozoicomonas arenosclerae]|uniref:GNAT family N-acetyltransferase n=1 Tax=Endozoicomonas arenosclerae TaxID=1633495 RepID=UPI00078483B2|nr:GNAT family N-acetyltransferase [Endozoicomonas arenosclerae]
MFTIRPAEIKDSRSLAIIGQTVWITTYAIEGIRNSFLDFIAEEFSEAHMHERIKTEQVLVVESGEHLCGYAVLERPEKEQKSELVTLYLLPEFQGNGLGKTLLDEAIKLAPQGIWLSCYEGNQKALNFYKKQGLTVTGTRYFELDNEKHLNWILESQPA